MGSLQESLSACQSVAEMNRDGLGEKAEKGCGEEVDPVHTKRQGPLGVGGVVGEWAPASRLP